MTKPLRYFMVVLMFLLAAALLGGCGSPQGTPANSRATGVTQCGTMVLAVSVNTSQAGIASGSTYLPLNFTNTSAAPCEMNGFPGVSLMTAPRGVQVGPSGVRDPSFGASGVVLRPGHTAHAWLQLAQAKNYPAHACDRVVATWLRVYPPGQRAAAYIPHHVSACRSTADGIVTVLPVRAGVAARGSVP